jgi:hypothetical protein
MLLRPFLIVLLVGSVAWAADPIVTPATPASVDDLDAELLALSTDQQLSQNIGAADERSLDIYGFADFTFRYTTFTKDRSGVLKTFNAFPYPTFVVGNINLYLDAKLGGGWRSLTEARFLYLPNGAIFVNTKELELDRTNTSVQDYTDENRSNLRWGGISIERVQIEYKFHDRLTVMAGQFLTPYGIWNVDHGSPTLIAVDRPNVIGESMFPERLTGLQFLGVVPIRDALLGYHLTLSNGRGPIDTYRDLDKNKAVSGRLWLRGYWLGEIILGCSFYAGDYTDRKNLYALGTFNGIPQNTFFDRVVEQYHEFAMAADLRWEWKDVVFLAEAIVNDRLYNDKARPIVLNGSGSSGLQADFRRWGSYFILGYHTPWFGLMPFITFGNMSYGDRPFLRAGYQAAAGINWHLKVPVVIKAQWIAAGILDGKGAYEGGRYERFTTQITYMF